MYEFLFLESLQHILHECCGHSVAFLKAACSSMHESGCLHSTCCNHRGVHMANKKAPTALLRADYGSCEAGCLLLPLSLIHFFQYILP